MTSMREIKKATILGVNGTMGSGSAAILAGFGGIQVYALARSMEKAEKGVEDAVKSIRSSVVRDRMIPGTYEKDLESSVAKSDWVFECVAESYETKEPLNQKISASRRQGTLVSTISSGLSIERLASCFDEDGKSHYYGTHFFNPPYKLTLCELVCHKGNDPSYTKELSQYLSHILRRYVVITNDTPAFAGNRIGFQLMNEASQLAEKYQDRGGIYLMDLLLGGYTGRAMSPLATVDLVGIDVHKAIVDNIYENTEGPLRETFRLPHYMKELMDQGSLGNKTRKGLYRSSVGENGKKIREMYHIVKKEYVPFPKLDIPFQKQASLAIRDSDYALAVQIIQEAEGWEADLVRHFLARYISYSFSLIPEVTDQNGIDGAMGYGFSWLPPSVWVDLWGGTTKMCKFLESQKMEVPDFLRKTDRKELYQLQSSLDYRSLFKAI